MRRAMCTTPSGTMMPVSDEAEVVAAMKAVDKTLWVDIERPTGDDLRLLGEGFGFHPLSVRDVAEPHSLPKLDEYDSYVFQTVMAPRRLGVTDEVLQVELSIYFLPGTLVTVRDEPWAPIDELWDGVVRDPARELGKGAQVVFHNVVDRAVRAYESVIDSVEQRIDTMEPEVLTLKGGDATLTSIFRLRRTLRQLLRLVRAQQESVYRLSLGHVKSLRKETCYLFRDVYDHLVRYHALLDDHRETLAGLRDTYIGVASNRLNEVMRRLTVFSALLLPLTFLTGLWGMNFDVLPFAHHGGGFWFFVGLCIVVVGGLFWLMVRAGWLRRV
jgi:magnesium transporter